MGILCLFLSTIRAIINVTIGIYNKDKNLVNL